LTVIKSKNKKIASLQMNTAAIRMRNGFQLIYVDIGNTQVSPKSNVIVETEQGIDIGKVMKIGRYAGDDDVEVTGKLVRIASIEDIASTEQLEELEEKAFADCKERAVTRNLDMKLVSVKSLFDKTKLIFYFVSANRIDFRELVKELAFVFKARIEMRQIGVRDQARIVGGYGPCGRIQCCVIQKDDFAPVSIKMAKDQHLNLNSLKISGMCGRLLCCLGAESETYRELNENLPAVGAELMYGSLVFNVTSVDTLKQTLKIKNEERFLEISCDDLDNKNGTFSIKKGVLERIAAVDEQNKDDDDDDSYFVIDGNAKNIRKR